MAVHILVPYNFTENDQKSIDFVGHRYAERQGVEITLFHAYTPVPEMDYRDTPIMKKVVHNAHYLRLRQDEQKHLMGEAKAQLMNYGMAGHHIHCLFKPIQTDVATDILQLWKDGKFDALVLNRNPGNIVNFFTRSISKRLARHIQGGIGVHIVS